MPNRRRTVLCVDDNREFVDNLAEILGAKGYDVLTASSCTEGAGLAAAGFDVALVDVMLPDGAGTDLVERLRGIDTDGQVILLTGFASLESAAAAVRAGAWAYLVKPCAIDDLVLSIEQALRQVRLLEESRDLMRRTVMAEKLAAIGTLTAGLSHEIKNPLNAASLQLKVLESRMKRLPDELRGQYVQPLALVQDEIARLNGLLQEFLDFARPRDLHLERVDLVALIERVMELLAPEATRADVSLEVRGERPLVALVDEQRMHQVVVNLVRNAIQATPSGGVVRVETGSASEMATVIVEDSGPGIPLDQRRRIFEPFFTTKPAGSGLGLPLVHSVVEQHRGTMLVDSSDLGGARFELSLPIADV